MARSGGSNLNGDSYKGLTLAVITELIAMIWGSGSVRTFHAGPVQVFFPKNRSRFMAPFYAMAFSLLRKVICNNQAVKDNILTDNVPEDKVSPIPAFSVQYLDYVPVALPDKMEDSIQQHDFVIASYFFPRPESYVKSMLSAAQNYDAVLSQTRPPEVKNTVKEKADLLVQLSE